MSSHAAAGRVRFRAGRAIAAAAALSLVGIALAAVVGPLDAGAASRKPSLSASLPTRAQHGQQLTISGRALRVRRAARSRYRAVLQRRSGRTWRKVARARLTRRAVFTLHWRAPSSGSRVTLRVALVRGGRVRAVARRRALRLLVPPPPVGNDTPPPAAHEELGELPIDPAEVDGYQVTAGVGGGDFTTRVPFAKGSRIRVSQGQGGGYSHSGAYTRHAIDLAAGAGTPVLAGFSGVIAAAAGGCAASGSWGCNRGFGNFVYLKHADGTCALFAHLTAINVAAGQQVARYSQLGTVGSSGSSTGAHLHMDRLVCTTRISLPWAFEEAGQPREGQTITSGNEPPPPAATPTPTAPTPTAPARRVITVDNRVTNGMGMREDTTPARLTTKPWIRCSTRGCNINGTERSSGGTYDAAVCQTTGERTTNGHDGSASDDANPERFESTRYYGVRLGNGTFGYVSEVWIRASDRGGLGLPGC